MFLKDVRSKGKLPNIAENEQNANDLVEKILIYRTRAIKGRALYSKIIFWALRLSNKKHIKIGF